MENKVAFFRTWCASVILGRIFFLPWIYIADKQTFYIRTFYNFLCWKVAPMVFTDFAETCQNFIYLQSWPMKLHRYALILRTFHFTFFTSTHILRFSTLTQYHHHPLSRKNAGKLHRTSFCSKCVHSFWTTSAWICITSALVQFYWTIL